jgi:hypothetical protein
MGRTPKYHHFFLDPLNILQLFLSKNKKYSIIFMKNIPNAILLTRFNIIVIIEPMKILE